ncbi:SLIT-ROBO Rho GTPase-activating protein 2 [Galemys pyrenaicus]|uniref:SLIT-ROBO Rho GTPase-activating protein 2 n=1 Tax=Galemys pyrenaicus TaxID=202257 RepID=A0A8J6AEU8_GALPY|nr:SLIT-ROBO Rho GTPase-activating protein 2 [Galemys pyrenaicus]
MAPVAFLSGSRQTVLCFPAEIRAQLTEQMKCLDQQCELRVQLLQDLQDFFRKKAEIEMDYSRNLEKLAERFLAKTRSTKDQQFK